MSHVTTPGVPFSPPSISDDEIARVLEVLDSGWLTTGPRAAAFEREFASFVGAPHALAVNSCTAALHLALLAAGIGPGDEVITTPLTFCATANTIVHTGATPVFADIDPVTMNLDPEAAAAAITPRTRAILPVHFAGRPVDVDAFSRLAARHDLTIIEDAAHAVAASSRGRRIGSTADFTCFSFYSTKNLTTGEGGMLTGRSAERMAWARVASLHGMSRDAWRRYGDRPTLQYEVAMAGFKYNMPDIQAALGLAQLARLDELQAIRARLWHRYDEGLASLPLVRPAPVAPGDVHGRHLYTVLVDPDRCGWTRDGLQEALHAEGIATSVHFRALHLQPFYADRYGFRRGCFPHAEFVADRTLSLPFSAALATDDVDRVIDALARLVR